MKSRLIKKTGLYDPAYEHDSCGVGFVANIKGVASKTIIDDAYEMQKNMAHRAGVGAQLNTRSCFSADPLSYKCGSSSILIAGDCIRGQSLVVWAIREGREVACSVDQYLNRLAKSEAVA